MEALLVSYVDVRPFYMFGDKIPMQGPPKACVVRVLLETLRDVQHWKAVMDLYTFLRLYPSLR
jgi:hypothetical protein